MSDAQTVQDDFSLEEDDIFEEFEVDGMLPHCPASRPPVRYLGCLLCSGKVLIVSVERELTYTADAASCKVVWRVRMLKVHQPNVVRKRKPGLSTSSTRVPA